jgi:prepilin-type N-terminal cleavage/methylation domain-containing protein
MMRAGRQKGFSLVEVMVSLAVLGVAAGLIFGVQMRMTGALRDQQNVAEVQQTLRSGAAVVSRDVRQAGFLAVAVFQQDDGVNSIPPVQIVNAGWKDATFHSTGAGSPDSIYLKSATSACQVRVCDTNGVFCPKHGPGFNSAESEVDNNSCFQDGQIVFAVRTINNTSIDPPLYAGTGCILEISHAPQGNSSGDNLKLQHHPLSPWNSPGNDQCDALKPVWNDGYTMFMGISLRAYRIKPDDGRGVLQMSEDNGTTWQDVALGIIDMQLAARVYHDDANDLDHDGDPNRDWFSGDAMSTLTTTVTNPKTLMVSMTLVAKTTKDVNGPRLTEVPTLSDTTWPSTSLYDADHNRLSDKGAMALPVTDTTSMYYGDVVYRIFTTTIDLRNVGVGIDGHI